jgi:hydrogenase expression/formation protein HypE
VREEVRGACELLGLDPLNVANEGKLLAWSRAAEAEALLAAMRAHPLGRRRPSSARSSRTRCAWCAWSPTIGGERVIDWLHGEQLPRIC